MRSSPIAVLISDIHYNLQTLEVADKAMRLAINKANELDVPLIVAGDLHDTKANMRAECVNAMLETFSLCDRSPYVLRGNHDQINEKSEAHALNFLNDVAYVIDTPMTIRQGENYVIRALPYQSNPDEVRTYLRTASKDAILIMHQGLKSSASGDYIQDHSAITKDDVAGFRVISGHYHTRQTIELPDGGKWDYIGNPFSLGFGEANDPPKGFQVLYDGGSLEFIATNLRKHVVVDMTIDQYEDRAIYCDGSDLVWLKVRGPADKLAKYNKEGMKELLYKFNLPQDFRLDLIPDEVTAYSIGDITSNPGEVLDAHIDSQTMPDERKERLKQLWRSIK